MKIFVLILTVATLGQSKSNVKTPAKRAILGHGLIENGYNSIANPNKNAYLPPPIQQYPVEQSQSSQQSGILSSEIEPPASDYLPPFETSPAAHHNHIQTTQNGFVPVGTSQESQYRAAGYLPPLPQNNGHLTHQTSQPQHPSNYRAPDYLPPLASQPSGHSTISQQSGHGIVSQPGIQSPSRAPEYLPPNNHPHQHIDNPSSAYNAPGYLPPSEGSYKAAGYLPPHPSGAEYTNSIHQAHASYGAPDHLPPVSHQSVSARVPPSIDFEQSSQSTYNAAGYLPPVSSSSSHDHTQLHSIGAQQSHLHHVPTAQVPHTIYGTPKSHSQASVYVSPSSNTAAVSLGSQYAPSVGHAASYDRNQHQQEVNHHRHYHEQSHVQHHQQTYNVAQQSSLSGQSYPAQTQAYAPTYSPQSSHQGSQATYSVTPQSHGIPVPHEYSAPLPMYSPNPTSQYAAEAPTYQTNNGYLPPHTDLLPPTQHHHNHHTGNNGAGYDAPATNNGYLPPIGTQHISGELSENDIRISSNQIQNSGSESSQQQYASSFPTYSDNHDGYDYSKPQGTSFEDGHSTLNHNLNHNLNHQNTIITGEPQPDLHVVNVGNEGGYQQEIKIIRIIDETRHGAIPNIRTLKIIKETTPGEPNHSSVQTIRIISEPHHSTQVHANNPVQNHVSIPQVPSHINVPQVPEHHEVNNLQVLRSESAGENVEGGYLPPTPVLQPPSGIQQPPIDHYSHVPQVHHSHIPQTVAHPPPPPPPIHNQHIHPVPANTPEYLPPLTSHGQENVQPSHNQQPYLPPLSTPTTAHNPTSNVKILRILHDRTSDQQQDAIYAGVAEHNGNDVNTIRVIHQQEADTSGRYGYPSPQLNTVKLLRYYRRY